jgi:tudor domain-containing protein 5
MEPPKQILTVEKTSALNAVETSRLNHAEKLNQVRYLSLEIEIN